MDGVWAIVGEAKGQIMVMECGEGMCQNAHGVL